MLSQPGVGPSNASLSFSSSPDTVKHGGYSCSSVFRFQVWGCIEGREQQSVIRSLLHLVFQTQYVCMNLGCVGFIRYPESWQGSLSLIGCHYKSMPAHIAFSLGSEYPTPVLIYCTNGATQATLFLGYLISSVTEAITAIHRSSVSKCPGFRSCISVTPCTSSENRRIPLCTHQGLRM